MNIKQFWLLVKCCLILVVCLIFRPINVSGQGEKEFTDVKEQAIVKTVLAPQSSASLPREVNLSMVLPPAGEKGQGRKTSCWAWATAYGVRSYLDNPKKIEYFRAGTNPDFSKIYSPEFVYQRYKGNACSLTHSEYAYEILQKILLDGVVKYSDLPYDELDCNKQPDITMIGKARLAIKPDYEVKFADDDFTIKRLIADSIPLIISMKLGSGIYALNNMKTYKGNKYKNIPIWESFGSKSETHAMIIAGYSEHINSYLILNSWGENFGNKGYAWVSYNILNPAMNYCCYAVKKKTNKVNDITVPRLQNIQRESAKNIDKSQKFSSKFIQLSKEDLDEIDSLLFTPDTAYFKETYYLPYAGFKISLVSLNVKSRQAEIKIMDENFNTDKKFTIDEHASTVFYFENKKYELNFIEIAKRGRNPFKKAMVFSLNQQRPPGSSH